MRPSEVPDNLKGNITYSEDGIMTLNHPEKGIVLLEPDPILITPEDFPDLSMQYLITMVEAIANTVQALADKQGITSEDIKSIGMA